MKIWRISSDGHVPKIHNKKLEINKVSPEPTSVNNSANVKFLVFYLHLFLVSKGTEHRTKLLNPVNDRPFKSRTDGTRYRFLDSVFFLDICVELF